MIEKDRLRIDLIKKFGFLLVIPISCFPFKPDPGSPFYLLFFSSNKEKTFTVINLSPSDKRNQSTINWYPFAQEFSDYVVTWWVARINLNKQRASDIDVQFGDEASFFWNLMLFGKLRGVFITIFTFIHLPTFISHLSWEQIFILNEALEVEEISAYWFIFTSQHESY